MPNFLEMIIMKKLGKFLEGEIIMRSIFFVIFLFLALICLDSCEKNKSVVGPDATISFDIYVSSDDIPYGQPVQLDELNLLHPPLLSLSDISTYSWKKHHISYPDSVWNKLKTWDDLLYKGFVLKVNDERIYWGSFINILDVSIFPTPVIPLIPDQNGNQIIPSSILLERCTQNYAGSESDPRNDLRIYNALLEAGVLVEYDSSDTIPAKNSFSISIASDDIPFGNTIQLDELHLLQPPLLSLSDITCYRWNNHHISYPDSVWDRMITWGKLLHKIFVVSMGDERIYWGRFLDMLDSAGCQNPVIFLIPRQPDGRNTTPGIIMIEREYPFYVRPDSYPDPRDDSRIYNAMLEAGVLVDLENAGVPAE